MLADQAARDRMAGDLDTTLVIEAAAGTGKTTALVSRIVAVLAAGRTTLERIVAVTFTDKAAGELKLRVREEIERARLAPGAPAEVRARLEQALPHLEQARIGTIHSFCADLLHERPVEAGVDPRFEVASREVAAALLNRAFERWFEAALADPGEGVRRILCRRDYEQHDGPRAILRRAAQELCDWRDFDSPWRRDGFDRQGAIDALIAQCRRVGSLAEFGEASDYLAQSLARIDNFVKEATRLEAERGRDYDVLEAQLCGLLRGWGANHWNWRGGRTASFGELARAEAIGLRDALREQLERFRAAAHADLASHLRDELWPVIDHYRHLKRRAGALDFMDLLLVVRDLVRGNRSVRAGLQERFSHIFIDEFQDTDPLQVEILLLLAAADAAESDWSRVRPHPGKLFIVGDPKQSIYRFRRADVSLYQRVKNQLRESGAAIDHLTVSFRARPDLQRLVNAAFAPLMVESPTQAAYVPLERHRGDDPGQPAVVALPVPAPYADYGDRARITKRQLDRSLPDAAGALVHWLVARSGWKVTDRDHPAEPRPITARDICILLRRFNAFGADVTRGYVRALEARGVPHVLVGGSSFHEREEVTALRAALRAVERPDDELAVFATLRGPMFALSDAALLGFRGTAGSLHPFRRIPDGLRPELGEVAEALAVLRELHRGRNRRSVADTVARLLAATRAHAGFAMWPTGEQALANIARLMDEARRYEARKEGVSFRGFVDLLEAKAKNGEAGEAGVIEEGTDGVRLMTVHGAKGLEFPVVVLADITCNETASEAQRYVDPARGLCALRIAGCAPAELLEHNAEELRRDAEEAARLLYVASTRARDLLVVPVVGDEPQEGWLARLNPVLYPPPSSRRAPLAQRPPGCPEFGDDSAATDQRPPAAPTKAKSVAPGLYRIQPGGDDPGSAFQVVWWDPSALDLDVEETMGLRQTRLLEADESRQISGRGIEAHRAWQEQRAATLARGATPSLRVETATELAAAAGSQSADARRLEQDVEVEQATRDPARPHGPRFGTLLHVILLNLPFDADRAAIAKTAAFQARVLGASAQERAAAGEAAARALDSSVMRRARAAAQSGACRRECPLMVKLEDATLVEGIADLAFAEREGSAVVWTVVDFKTDLEIAGRIDEYRAQIALYMRAITASTGKEARGVLLWT